MVFFVLVFNFYGLPLHIIRDVYLTVRTFGNRLRDFMRYREATRNMENRYPTATQAELDSTDKVCIICREEMSVGGVAPNDASKKLPCGHLFHFRCLRSWLERQQACPTWFIGLMQPSTCY